MSKLLIMTFFTKGTPYEADALKLIETCEKFGYDIRFVDVDCTGDWAENCNLKANTIHQIMFDDSEHERFLFLDADCWLRAKIPHFETTESEMELEMRDPSKIRLNSNAIRHRAWAYTHGALWNSGVLFLRKTDRVMAMLKGWQSWCEAFPSVWDQVILQSYVAMRSVNADMPEVRALPHEYRAGGAYIGHASGSHRHWGEDVHKILLLGSAPDVPFWWKEMGQKYLNDGWVITAMNNAWRVPYQPYGRGMTTDVPNAFDGQMLELGLPTLHVWFRPNDFDGERPPDERLADNRDGWNMKPFWTRTGRISMIDTMYHILNEMQRGKRKLELHVVGMDCIFDGDGSTHFYGTGAPDPLKYGEEWLNQELKKLQKCIESNGSRVLNAGGLGRSRLPFPRHAPLCPGPMVITRN